MSMDYFNIIIVEDEEDIRNGLTHVVDWESIGFKISGVFSDGKDAIEHLKIRDVDVIISDIVMPRMTGLDVAKWVKDNRPQIIVVLLSGHSDFSYAQQAIKYNVKNYLLKPTDIDEIYEVFRLIRENLERQMLESIERHERDKKHEKALPFFQQMMFGKFLNEGIPEENTLVNILESSGFKGDTAQYSWWFCTLKFDAVAEAQEINCISQKNIDRLFSLLNGSNDIFLSVPVRFKLNRIELITWSEIKNDCKNEQVEKYLASRMIAVKNLLGFDLKVEKATYYSDFKKLITDNMRTDSGNFSEQKHIREIYSEGEDNSNPAVTGIKGALSTNEADAIFAQMRAIAESNMKDKLVVLQKYAMTLIFELRIHFIDNMLDIPVICNDESVFQKIIRAQSTDIILLYCAQVLDEYKKQIAIIEKPYVRKIKEYIEEHIFEEINTCDFAELVYLNPTYLSRMFKKETGENITQYILGRKMEKAKVLLADPKYKVYQIGEMVGYKDVRHFYKIFKKTYGLTPQDYRNKA